MTEPRPFRARVFLYRVLVGIFIAEAGFLAFAFWKCSLVIPNQPVPMLAERCPNIGQRTQELFGVAIATTLSLLTGTSESTPSN